MLFRIPANNAFCFEWIKHFERFATTRQHGKWRQALFYATVAVRTAQRRPLISAIITTSFHPHTTHPLQPLDLVCFQPFKHFHAEAVGVAARTGCLDFEFLAALSTIREQAFKRTAILSAFRQTGLILLSELPAATLSPPGTPPLEDCVPKLKVAPHRSLHKRYAKELWNYNDPTCATCKQRPRASFTGILAQAQIGAQAVDEFVHTDAAQLA